MVNVLNVPENMCASPDYSMTVNGKSIFLCELSGFSGGTISLGFLELDSEVEISISCKNKLKSAKVHPLSYGIEANVESQIITFKVSEPKNLCIMVNDSFSLPIYLFISKPHKKPEINDNLIHFKPGIYNVGRLQLKSGQTLWLDDGAVLNGTVYAEDASNVKICGRGIIRTSFAPFCSNPSGSQEVVGFIRCKDVYMEGITIIDSFSWTVVAYECDNVHIDNIKIINERPYSTDGINPCNSAHVLIENCFIRSKDDCVTIKGFNAYNRPCNGRKPVEDIVVRDCVFWCDNNNAMVVGSETMADYFKDIHFLNCDVLKVTGTCGDMAGVMSVISLHDGDVSDISFEGINVEYSEAPLINVFYTNEIFRIPGVKRPQGGKVGNILFKDINVTGGPFRWSYIRGVDEKRTIDGVTIENLNILGKKVKTAEDAELACWFANDVKII